MTTSFLTLIETIDQATPLPTMPAVKDRRRIREAANVSQEQAAVAMGVAGASVARWERGASEPTGLGSDRYRQFLAACEAIAA